MNRFTCRDNSEKKTVTPGGQQSQDSQTRLSDNKSTYAGALCNLSFYFRPVKAVEGVVGLRINSNLCQSVEPNLALYVIKWLPYKPEGNPSKSEIVNALSIAVPTKNFIFIKQKFKKNHESLIFLLNS